MVIKTGASILEELIEPNKADLSPEAARSILQLDFRPEDHRQVKRLSAKPSAGTLTAQEQAQLDEYIRVADLLAILQSKARRTLKRRSPFTPSTAGSARHR